MNRTNTLLYKNTPLTLYSKVLMLVVCETWVGDGDRLLHIDPKFFSRPSSSSWQGCSTVGHWGPKPSVWSWFSLCRHPISNCDWNWIGTHSSRLWHLVILLFDTHLLPVGVRICNEFNHVHGSRWYSDIFTRFTCFAVLLLIYTGASLDWRLGRGSICYTMKPKRKLIL